MDACAQYVGAVAGVASFATQNGGSNYGGGSSGSGSGSEYGGGSGSGSGSGSGGGSSGGGGLRWRAPKRWGLRWRAPQWGWQWWWTPPRRWLRWWAPRRMAATIQPAAPALTQPHGPWACPRLRVVRAQLPQPPAEPQQRWRRRDGTCSPDSYCSVRSSEACLNLHACLSFCHSFHIPAVCCLTWLPLMNA